MAKRGRPPMPPDLKKKMITVFLAPHEMSVLAQLSDKPDEAIKKLIAGQGGAQTQTVSTPAHVQTKKEVNPKWCSRCQRLGVASCHECKKIELRNVSAVDLV